MTGQLLPTPRATCAPGLWDVGPSQQGRTNSHVRAEPPRSVQQRRSCRHACPGKALVFVLSLICCNYLTVIT